MTRQEAAQKASLIAAERKKQRPKCRRGHYYGPPAPRGVRICRICAADNQARQRALACVQMSVDPTDERHGTYHGYNVGCRCTRCDKAARDYRKRRYERNQMSGTVYRKRRLERAAA